MRANNHEAGISLVEMLVVLTIIALLAAVVGPRLIGYVGKARTDTARVQMRELSSAIELYRLDTGVYPPPQAGLKALVERPPGIKNWTGPYLKKVSGLQDPWGNEYAYVLPGKKGDYDIVSLGRDGQPGGDGEDADIGNWQ